MNSDYIAEREARILLRVAKRHASRSGVAKRRPALARAAILLLLMTGCGKDYGQQKLGRDSPQGRQVAGMVQALRQAGEKGLDPVLSRQAVEGLSQAELQALRAGLIEIVRAKNVEFERLDKFGPQVYRATFMLEKDGAKQPAAMLLVDKDGLLRWAKAAS
jgi:hypothetical protein